MKLKSGLFALFLLAFGSLLYAQDQPEKLTYSASLSTLDYSGDYGNSLFSFSHGIALNGSISYNLGKSFDIMAELSWGTVNADKVAEKNPGMRDEVNFKAKIFNLNLMAKYKLANGYLLQETAKIAPYLIGGIGGFYSTSSGTGFGGFNDAGYTLSADFTDKKVAALLVCAGLGAKYQVNPKIGIFIECRGMLLLNDDIDGWNPNYDADQWSDSLLKNSIGIIFTPGNKNP